MSDNLLLRDYNPTSMMTVKHTEITKPRFPVFDGHIHIGSLQMSGTHEPINAQEVVDGLKSAGIFGAINLKMFWGEPLKEHIAQFKGYEDFIRTFGSVDVARLEEPDFPKMVDENLREMKAMGVNGLKLWKNIGCGIKDSTGKFIMPDDERLRPIWEGAAKYKMLVLFHIADPKSFFTPVDEKNEFYESLINHPDWVFYGNGFPTFEALMQAQENLIARNPQTTFVIPHVGSCSEDLGWVGAQLDKHPNMYIDTSARINLLGRQPYTCRDFMLKYQDRILFGTDAGFGGAGFDIGFYADHYRFFETYDEYLRPIQAWGWDQGRWYVYGLGLPDDVLKKFYSENVLKLLKSVE
ncbi:MAG: amidohydrolase family protein [Defluviitaleaceae bacterium]|nr:amidohydrolase family protein [Defluviitaleaceae bacterium]MCL2274357.1 amidohydrolase family protein [Defluviitaleaceae bacterium]